MSLIINSLIKSNLNFGMLQTFKNKSKKISQQFLLYIFKKPILIISKLIESLLKSLTIYIKQSHKMQVQQFAISRLTQHQVEQRLSQLNALQNTSFSVVNTVPQQFKNLKHLSMFKLGYNNIFMKNENSRNFFKKQLSNNQSQKVQNQFYQLRQLHQDHVYSFIKKYKSQTFNNDDIENNNKNLEYSSHLTKNVSAQQTYTMMNETKKKMLQNSPSSPIRSKTSSRRFSEGGYFFNNWRSYQSYYCTNAKTFNSQKQNLVSNLVYSVIDMDYDMSLKIIDKINQITGVSYEFSKGINSKMELQGKVKEIQINIKKQKKAKSLVKKKQISTFQLNSLKIIIKGLKTLFSIIKIIDQSNQNQQLSQIFFNRNQFILFQDDYLNDPKAKINLLNLSNVQQLERNITRQSNDSVLENQYEQKMSHKKFDKKPNSNLSNNLKTNSPKNQSKNMMKSTQNLISYKLSDKKYQTNSEWRKFIQLPPKYQKICILNNLIFLINFTKKIKIQSCQNDYYKLLFTFLKNGADQLEKINMEKKSTPRYHKKSQSNIDYDSSQDEYSNVSDSSKILQNGLNFKSEIDYVLLLLELKGLKIYDRINFATRLLCKQKKIQFVHKIQQAALKLCTLDNLLLFSKFYKQQVSKSLQQFHSFHHLKQQKPVIESLNLRSRKNSSQQRLSKYFTQHQLQKRQKPVLKKSLQKCLQNKQQLGIKLKNICQNYVDQYGDLATVAYLSNQYPCLYQFSQFYRESLLLSYESEEVQKLDFMKLKSMDQISQKRIHTHKMKAPFLYEINFRQQKVNQDIHEQNLQSNEIRKCQICNLKVYSDRKECYIQCNKCKHGGHLQHLVKWYNNYQNCPNINCACLCN